MKTSHPVDDLLPAWGAWVRADDSTGALGYAQVQYSEYIARSHSASDYSGDWDPRVLALDKIIRSYLPHTPRVMLTLRYVARLPDKAAAVRVHLSRQEFSRVLHVAVLPTLRHAWDCQYTAEIDSAS